MGTSSEACTGRIDGSFPAPVTKLFWAMRPGIDQSSELSGRCRSLVTIAQVARTFGGDVQVRSADSELRNRQEDSNVSPQNPKCRPQSFSPCFLSMT